MVNGRCIALRFVNSEDVLEGQLLISLLKLYDGR